jgi:hypothetical protein
MRFGKITIIGLATAWAALPSASMADPINNAHVNQPFGNQGHGCGVGDDTGPGMVGTDITCGSPHGYGHAEASAFPGQVYALSEAVHYSLSFGDEIIGTASSRDYVVFSGPASTVDVSFNVMIGGSETSARDSWALIGALATLGGAGSSLEKWTNYLGGSATCSADFANSEGCGVLLLPQFLTTATVTMPTNTPIELLLRLNLRTYAQGVDSSSRAEYEMRLATDADLAGSGRFGVFNLPDGFSVDAQNPYLVDNHYAPPQFIGDDGDGSGAVPEPTAWAMMLAGFGAIGGMLRRRREVANVPA